MDDPHNQLPQNRNAPQRRKGGKEVKKGGTVLHHHKQHPVQKRNLNTFTKMRADLQHKGSARRNTRRYLWQSSRSTSSRQKSTPGRILLANSTERSHRICKDMPTMSETCQLSHRPTRGAHQCNLTLAIRKMGTRPSRTLPVEIRTSQIPHSGDRLIHKMDRGKTPS